MSKFTKEERSYLEKVITLKTVNGRIEIDTVRGDVESIIGDVRMVIGSVQTVTLDVENVGGVHTGTNIGEYK
nr:hypothetical protein [uncultured Mediterranean phage uvMED]